MLSVVRGETEVGLLGMEGLDVFIVRPGVVEAAKKEGAGWLARFASAVTPVFRVLTPGLHIYGNVLAKGFIKIALEGMKGVQEVLGEEKRVILSKEMKRLGMSDSEGDFKT